MEGSPKPPKNKALRFFLRIILAGVVLSVLLYLAGPFYIRALLPLFSHEIEILHPEYDIREFRLDRQNRIMYQIKVYRVGVDHEGNALGGSEVKAGIVGRTLYISPLILYSFLLAWPGLSIKERFKAFLISLPLFIIIQLVDIPMDIINRVEAPWGGRSLSGQIREFWYYLLNNGGRQFLALIIALVSIAWVRIAFPEKITGEVGRNDPCPCGSGKKFKKCCGK